MVYIFFFVVISFIMPTYFENLIVPLRVTSIDNVTNDHETPS